MQFAGEYYYSSAWFYETGIDNWGFLFHYRSELNSPGGEAIAQDKAQHQQGRKGNFTSLMGVIPKVVCC